MALKRYAFRPKILEAGRNFTGPFLKRWTIPEEMIRKYRNRIINVHPSLIPSFCGVGYYGLKVHEAALSRGVKLTGATVHFVDEGVDSGPIILQKAVEVLPGDTPKILQKRVMEQAEWKILPQAIHMIANKELERADDGSGFSDMY